MKYATSRSFVLPISPEEMSTALWFNLWKNKNWPYRELEVGDVVLWYESATQRLRWLTKVVEVHRFEYSSKADVAQQLDLDQEDRTQPYFTDGPDSGYCLAYRVDALAELAEEKPPEFRFPMLGWMRLADDADTPWSGWSQGTKSGIPDGITKEFVLGAIKALDEGEPHAFGPSTGYDLVFDGRRYPPKAVIGLAAASVVGKKLGPYDFKGGDDSKCFRILRDLNFEVLKKSPAPTQEDHKPTADPEEFENRRRCLRGNLQEPPTGVKHPEKVTSSSESYKRDPGVAAWVRDRAKGKCELCGDQAPFLDRDGEPYLENHHVQWLKDGGQDTTSNAVAVCPNCHRQLHFGADRDARKERLYAIVARLTRT